MTFINKNSDEGAGSQRVNVALGVGKFRILLANIFSDQEFAEGAHIGFDRELGDGTYDYGKLVSGYVKNQTPLCIANTREVIGPGRLYSSVFHLTSHLHTFQVLYERVGH